MTGDALARLQDHLERHDGKMTAADVPLGIAALREYLESGATLGRGLRRVRAAMKPTDPDSIQLGYLYNLVVDAATHEGRLAPVETYAASDFPLASAAAEMLAILESDGFRAQMGWRPTRPGDKRPS